MTFCPKNARGRIEETRDLITFLFGKPPLNVISLLSTSGKNILGHDRPFEFYFCGFVYFRF